jgi:hypothetical protein
MTSLHTEQLTAKKKFWITYKKAILTTPLISCLIYFWASQLLIPTSGSMNHKVNKINLRQNNVSDNKYLRLKGRNIMHTYMPFIKPVIAMVWLNMA